MAGNDPLDLLIAELLGDVGKLHAEIKELKQVIPTMIVDFGKASSDASSKLNAQTAQLLAAGEKYQKIVTELGDEAKRNIASQAMSTKRTLLAEIDSETKAAIETRIDQIVTAKIKESVTLLTDARKRLETSADAVGRASWRSLGWLILAAIIAAALVVTTQFLIGPVSQKLASLSPENSAKIKQGQDLQKAISQLDQKTQARIELILSTQDLPNQH